MIYLLTTDRQAVNYYSIIHILELIYFDSNAQETMKKQLYPSNSCNFLPLHWRNPAKCLTVTQAYTGIVYVYNVQKRLYTVFRQGVGKDNVIKRRLIVSRIFAQWIVAE